MTFFMGHIFKLNQQTALLSNSFISKFGVGFFSIKKIKMIKTKPTILNFF